MKPKVKTVKEDKKIFRKFIMIFALCFIAGMVMGMLARMAAKSEWSLEGLLHKMEEVLLYTVPVVFFLVNMVNWLVCRRAHKKAEALYRSWDGEDESIEEVDSIQNRGLLWNNIIYILSFLFMAIVTKISFNEAFPKFNRMVALIATSLCFIWSLLLFLIVQKKAVELNKRINPEKRGNIFDVHFHKEWEKSCDEAQRLTMYKASYRAYGNTQKACMILWLLCFMLDIAVGIGMLPGVMIIVVWMVQTVTYMWTAAKLEKGGAIFNSMPLS